MDALWFKGGTQMGKKVGMDVGTNMIVCAYTDENGMPVFKMQRDAFLGSYLKPR